MDPKQKLILIAEDDAVLRLIIVKLLSELGYVGHTAENGAEAVVLAAKIPYILILMDVQMPKLNGMEAARQIRAAEKKKGVRIPIVALTATTDRATCIEAGMDDFMSKPITTEQLKQVLDRWVSPRDVSTLYS